MAFDGDEELLQDFLVEAEEILERLGEQLIELGKVPDNKDLLNSVFRGFSTINDGAGFLNISNLVTICHRAEDVFNLLMQGDVRVHNADKQNIYKPSIDVTLSSVEHNVRGKDLAIILTGMGADGQNFVRLLKEKGSTVWAQDESTCVVYGMPMTVVEAGLADNILPPPEIGKMLSLGM